MYAKMLWEGNWLIPVSLATSLGHRPSSVSPNGSCLKTINNLFTHRIADVNI